MIPNSDGWAAASATTPHAGYVRTPAARQMRVAHVLQRRLFPMWAWFARHTYMPGWLPARTRHAWASYCIAIILEIAAAVITFQFVAFFPAFAVRGALPLLVLALVALEFGAGPSLVATGLGTFLLDFLLLPPYASLSLGKGASLSGVALFLVAGFLLVHLASQRERSRRAARTAMDIMEDFLNIASHELRAPVAGALLSMDLAERRLRSAQKRTAGRAVSSDVTDGIAESIELLDATRAHLTRQRRLVADLLDVARIQSGGFALQVQKVDLITVVVEAVQEMHRLEASRALTLHLPKTPIDDIMADPDRLRQVVINYVSNAIKYAPPPAPIHVRVSTTDISLRVEVRDEGPGVPLDQQQRIWERYQRGADAPMPVGAEAGLGLGLYISRTIIEGHGGQVGIESRPGQGATFWFTLPIASAHHRFVPDSNAGVLSENRE